MSFPVAPRGRLSELIYSHCASAGVLADRVGLAAEVRAALAYFFEHWDGGGLPVGAGVRVNVGVAVGIAVIVAHGWMLNRMVSVRELFEPSS